ncbi:IclR family transcriptional regulator [Spiractinospora alimapuensis]|uniref:IclR family transcriptional regulator n=1 Tax=Spiractinospora alimapuensis TaxID=2820884 RepID=UPI001F167E36|nr:IclR family transcriptional regulator [Spiractinospora alimapuensis]QVQ50908.1 IclR family transcriptional regulator [Spiractinospora alimapuensis]
MSASRKVLRILLVFEKSATPLSLSDISRRSGVPTSTALRILRDLCEEGFLEKVERQYQIGGKMFELGMRAPFHNALREVALPIMQDIQSATSQNVHLGVLEHGSVLVVQQLSGRSAVATPARVGGRLPAHSTSVGKALLAFSSPERVQEIVDAGLAPVTKHTIRTASALRQDLATTRTRGWSMATQENSIGTISVAAPVFGIDQYAVAALSIVHPFDETAHVQRYVHALRTAANTISRMWLSTNPDR